MTANTSADRSARHSRHQAILDQVGQEDGENAEAEASENARALNMPLHLRIDAELDAQLRTLAASEHIPTSALVRRLLRQAVAQRGSPAAGWSASQVEAIARRIVREELHAR